MTKVSATLGGTASVTGPLRAALLSPLLAERWQSLGAFLRYETTLTPRQSELAILVTGRACRSPFEWQAHVAEALAAGVEPAVIDELLAERVPAALAALADARVRIRRPDARQRHKTW